MKDFDVTRTGADRSLTRRRLLAKTGVAAIGTLVGGSLLVDKASAETVASPFEDASELDLIFCEAIADTLERHDLPLPPDTDKVTVGIEITDPRGGLQFEVNESRTDVLKSATGIALSGVILTAGTAHELVAGHITPAFALANGLLTMFGDRRDLGILHNLPNLARPTYERKLKAAGKAAWLKSNREKVI